MTHSILRLPAVKSSTGLSRSTTYLRVAQGLFTKLINLGCRAIAHIAGKTNAEVRDLVARLEAARKTAE